MSKEIYHEGWLIKSPPKKSIWLPKQWRRRWFTLKQGEIPEQFCLEYYEDRSCRILKGVIDLDQCEQVDSGMRLEHKKQKFQHMFDVKTPRRTYYLAAETEADMIDWVNCICQVCNLQEQQTTTTESRQYYNVGADAIINQPHAPLMSLNRREYSMAGPSSTRDMKPSPDLIQSAHMSLNRAQENQSLYQNFDAPLRQSSYTTRDTILCDAILTASSATSSALPSASNQKEEYCNFPAIAEANQMRTFERSHSLRTSTGDASGAHSMPSHGRTQSLVEQKSNIQAFGRKIPENLKLTERNAGRESEPSPALSTASGPYIAISECISGHPMIDKDPPATPLNSLDPKFYETPRNHINIGLNLTTNEQPYSPKRNNGPVPQKQSRSGRSSPTDSESVFTDDEDWVAPAQSEGTLDRRLRPSDSSVENDSIVYTYAQRFSKMPSEDDESTTIKSRHNRPTVALVLANANGGEMNKEANSSDTENASPAIPIGPKDINSCVEENYDIPRSHQMPYYNLNNSQENGNELQHSPTLSTISDVITASTPNLTERFSTMSLSSTPSSKFSTMQHRSRPHFYTNAAPSKVEGNVFRYDFDEQVEAPVVNRKLKPRVEEKKPKDVARPLSILSITSTNSGQGDQRSHSGAPCIDRKLKPATPQKPFETNSLRRGGCTNTLSLASNDTEFQSDHSADFFSKTLPRNYNNPTMTSTSVASVGSKQIGKLEYFDLDHSNPPPICKNANSSSASTSNLSAALTVGLPIVGPMSRVHSHRTSGFGLPSAACTGTLTRSHGDGAPPGSGTGIVYKSVDFIKTEAFMRTRQDAEKNRNLKNQTKD